MYVLLNTLVQLPGEMTFMNYILLWYQADSFKRITWPSRALLVACQHFLMSNTLTAKERKKLFFAFFIGFVTDAMLFTHIFSFFNTHPLAHFMMSFAQSFDFCTWDGPCDDLWEDVSIEELLFNASPVKMQSPVRKRVPSNTSSHIHQVNEVTQVDDEPPQVVDEPPLVENEAPQVDDEAPQVENEPPQVENEPPQVVISQGKATSRRSARKRKRPKFMNSPYYTGAVGHEIVLQQCY